MKKFLQPLYKGDPILLTLIWLNIINLIILFFYILK